MARRKATKAGASAPAALHWRTVEILGHAHYASQGARVLISPYDGATYDFVVEKDGEFASVNVKSATWDGYTYRISRAGGGRHDNNPGKYLVWLPKERVFIELPGDFLKKAKSRRIPKGLVPCQ